LEIIAVTIVLLVIVFAYASDGRIGFLAQQIEQNPIEDADYSKAYVDIVKNENSIIIEIMPDSTPTLGVNNFKIKLNPGENTTALIKNMQQGTEEEIPITQNEIELSSIISQDKLQANLDDKNKAILTIFEYQISFQNPADINSIEIEMKKETTDLSEISKITPGPFEKQGVIIDIEKSKDELEKRALNKKNKKPNIAMVTTVVDNVYHHLMSKCLESKKKYCDKHGYDFIVGGDEQLERGDGPLWVKYRLIQRYLPKYDYIFYSDADVLIMDYEVVLDDIINEHFTDTTHILVSVDNFPNVGNSVDKPCINTSNFFVKN